MKSDFDLIKQILLSIEDSEEGWLEKQPELPGYRASEVKYHIRPLIQAKLISAVTEPDPNDPDGRVYWYIRLKWKGHEFLDKIRDEKIWKATKENAAKIGNWSLSFIGEIAKSVAKVEAKNRLGLDL
ncbi:hypothetical protein CAP39_01385 [Sphingomonas sp. IBVSS1]|nr:hypothetical protein CAP39_01385 [Sphingomonas sp. IBVSS1]